jgi:hypothetical protein
MYLLFIINAYVFGFVRIKMEYKEEKETNKLRVQGFLLLLCGLPVLERALALTFGRFLILFRHVTELLCMSDQSVVNPSTFTGQHNTERRGQASKL